MDSLKKIVQEAIVEVLSENSLSPKSVTQQPVNKGDIGGLYVIKNLESTLPRIDIHDRQNNKAVAGVLFADGRLFYLLPGNSFPKKAPNTFDISKEEEIRNALRYVYSMRQTSKSEDTNG